MSVLATVPARTGSPPARLANTDMTPANGRSSLPTIPATAATAALRSIAGTPPTLMVSTIDHWGPADDIFRSTDGGATWKPIAATTDRDTSFSPYMANLLRGHRFDWWLAALAIDPFDSNHVMYGTGGTIWGTHDMTDFDAGKHTRWTIAADGVEETAVLALASPPWGAHLISGVGDIGGFTHDDFDVSPASFHTNPSFSNTGSIEFADWQTGCRPHGGNGGGSAGYSEDGGKTWRPISLPGAPAAAAPAAGRGRGGGGGGGFITVSAGRRNAFGLQRRRASSFPRTRARTWTASTGLFDGARPFADRVAPATFYALDTANAKIYTSTDSGAAFTAKPVTGLPQGGAARGGRGGGGGGPRIKASFARRANSGSLREAACIAPPMAEQPSRLSSSNISVQNFAFGKAAPNRENPAIFATGTVGGVQGIFRSDDNGASWVRVNDDQHQFGGSPSVMTADPRIYGRVYIGMNGRGVLCGDRAVNN